jgi:hypothetical protein
MLMSVALVVSHANVLVCPLSMASGVAVSEAVGAAGAGGGGTVDATFALRHPVKNTVAITGKLLFVG